MNLKQRFHNANERRLIKGLSQKGILKELKSTATAFGIVCSLHVAAMANIEKMPAGVGAWLTLTAASTVGFGDVSPKTDWGKVATVVLVYGMAIPLLGRGITLGFDYSKAIRDNILNGKRKSKMSDHIVFLNAPKFHALDYFENVMTEYRSNDTTASNKMAIIVSQDLKDGLSSELHSMCVTHVNEKVTSAVAFEKSNLREASTIVILSHDENDSLSDSVTYYLLDMARKENPDAVIIAEAVDSANKEKFLKHGATSVMPPMRGFPKFLASVMLIPGMEKVFEEFADTKGSKSTAVYFPHTLKDEWLKVSTDVTRHMGNPFAYIDAKNEMIINPEPSDMIEAKALLVLARPTSAMKPAQLAKILMDAAPS